MATVKRELTTSFTSEEAVRRSKISIVGTGSVGMAGAVSILLKGLSDELAFVDADEGKLMVDTLTHVAWELSACPQNRAVGSGCDLDAACVRFLIGQRLGIHSGSCHGLILGEHRDSSGTPESTAPVWSEHCWGPSAGPELRHWNCQTLSGGRALTEKQLLGLATFRVANSPSDVQLGDLTEQH